MPPQVKKQSPKSHIKVRGIETLLVASFAMQITGLSKARRNCDWTAGRYGQLYDDYHCNIDSDGSIYQTCTQLTELKNHTWQRNTGAIGIALCCAQGALPHSGTDTEFGSSPPTAQQIDAAGKLVAQLTQGLSLPIDRWTVLTHCEAALIDGYGPFSGDAETRWDLWYLRDSPGDGMMKPGGQVIRGKALWYAKCSPLE